jgi:hypothetical protein
MAKEILSDTSNKDLYFSEAEALVPRDCLWIWRAQVQGDGVRSRADFLAGREALFQRAKEHAKDPALLSALGLIDAALGRKKDAIEEAVEMLPISSDAWSGPTLVYNLAAVYALVNEPNLAINQLSILTKIPGGVAYGELKLDPAWNRLRQDPRFERRGFRIIAVRPGAVDESRRIKPSIPAIGEYGIPIHDEIELERII